MNDSRIIDTLLKIHGMSDSSPKEEIRAVLSSAGYTTDEIHEALATLGPTETVQTSRVEGLHKLYRTSQALLPSEVSALLGIEVEVNEIIVEENRTRSMSVPQYFIVLAVTILLAIGGLFYAMYTHGSGPFHPTVALFSR